MEQVRKGDLVRSGPPESHEDLRLERILKLSDIPLICGPTMEYMLQDRAASITDFRE